MRTNENRTSEATVTINGLTFLVAYEHYAGIPGSREDGMLLEPDEPESICIERVILVEGSIDMYLFFQNFPTMEQLEDAIAKQLLED